jgi:hypothetical protein
LASLSSEPSRHPGYPKSTVPVPPHPQVLDPPNRSQEETISFGNRIVSSKSMSLPARQSPCGQWGRIQLITPAHVESFTGGGPVPHTLYGTNNPSLQGIRENSKNTLLYLTTRPSIPSPYLRSQKAGPILIVSTGKEEAGSEVSAEAPATAFVILQTRSNSNPLSPEGQDLNPERTSVSCPAPTPHAVRTQYPRGSALHPHSTNRCLAVQEEALWCGGSGSILGGAHRIWGAVAAWPAWFKPVGSGWPERKGEFLGCTLASGCSFSSTLWLGCLQTGTAQSCETASFLSAGSGVLRPHRPNTSRTPVFLPQIWGVFSKLQRFFSIA